MGPFNAPAIRSRPAWARGVHETYITAQQSGRPFIGHQRGRPADEAGALPTASEKK